jgi:hypothetical protein
MTVTLDEIRHKASCFERRVRWRNMGEYVSAAVIIAIFGAMAFSRHDWERVPPLLLIAGTLWSMLELSRRAPSSPPSGDGVSACLDFYRRELERQRDALRSVFRWYLLPLVPGLIATIFISPRKPSLRTLLAAIVIALSLLVVWALNQWTARKLDRKIEKVIELQNSEL